MGPPFPPSEMCFPLLVWAGARGGGRGGVGGGGMEVGGLADWGDGNLNGGLMRRKAGS